MMSYHNKERQNTLFIQPHFILLSLYYSPKISIFVIIIIVANFSPVDIPVYELGVPEYESYEVVIHSNSTKYGGTRRIGKKTYKAYKTPMNGFDYSMKLFLDANSVMFLKKKKN